MRISVIVLIFLCQLSYLIYLENTHFIHYMIMCRTSDFPFLKRLFSILSVIKNNAFPFHPTLNSVLFFTDEKLV